MSGLTDAITPHGVKAFAVFQRLLLVVFVAASYIDTNVQADEGLAQASWTVPTQESIKQHLDAWLNEKKTSPEVRDRIEQVWNTADDTKPTPSILDRTIESLALADAEIRGVVEELHHATPATAAGIVIDDARFHDPLVQNNLRLFAAAAFVRRELYDEADRLATGLRTDDVVDPASLLFHRAVIEHRLLKRDACLETLHQLRENEAAVPRRYLVLAELMEDDLALLKPDSLDEVGRLMDDVRRRLDLGRAGKKVRDVEAEIIAKLDKKINDMEKQRQQQQQQSQQQQQPGASSPSESAQKSQAPADIHATDAVDPKKLGKAQQWGNLPPKQRQQALQQIGRDLPSHFRDTIEEYFKRLSQDGSE